MNKLRCAVIGVGYLGKFHAEKYASLSEATLVAVCDRDVAQASSIAHKCNTTYYADYHELLGQVDAVSIAVPTTLHYEVAKFFLSHRVHVLLEKPIATTVAEADELVQIAKTHGVVFQIGHLERFNTAVVALKRVLTKPQFIESFRLSPFQLRGSDVNVVLDLMIHDIDIIQEIAGSPIKEIYANGAVVLSQHIDFANARIIFENNCVANVTASRISLNKKRKLRVFQQDTYFSIDLQKKILTARRKGHSEMFPGIPEIIHEEQAFEQGDPLLEEIKAFIHAIQTHSEPVVTGEHGKRALATAIEITRIVTESELIV